jgi:hypothetical protein
MPDYIFEPLLEGLLVVDRHTPIHDAVPIKEGGAQFRAIVIYKGGERLCVKN